MANIVLSDLAPEGDLRFSLGNASFEAPYETNDPVVLADADAHPWLNVEREEVVELADAADPFPQVAPKDDFLSAENSVANDPEAVREALAERRESAPLAVDAGLDQDKVETTDSGVDLTLAGDEPSADHDDKPRKTRRAAKEN